VYPGWYGGCIYREVYTRHGRIVYIHQGIPHPGQPPSLRYTPPRVASSLRYTSHGAHSTPCGIPPMVPIVHPVVYPVRHPVVYLVRHPVVYPVLSHNEVKSGPCSQLKRGEEGSLFLSFFGRNGG